MGFPTVAPKQGFDINIIPKVIKDKNTHFLIIIIKILPFYLIMLKYNILF